MQFRLRISAPFYLIFTKCHFATSIARIYIILFNFQSVTIVTDFLLFIFNYPNFVL